jgi:hypothetical protein
MEDADAVSEASGSTLLLAATLALRRVVECGRTMDAVLRQAVVIRKPKRKLFADSMSRYVMSRRRNFFKYSNRLADSESKHLATRSCERLQLVT